jgi:hypothetical protein
MPQVTSRARVERWDERLYPGLRVAAVPADVREALARALGVLGVEAEHFLALVGEFTAQPPRSACTRAQGDLFLRRLEASGRRLVDAAQSFELATQAFLSALEAARPDLRGGQAGAADDLDAGAWWPTPDEMMPPGEALDLRLRRCGYAYRHAVAARLSANVEAIAEQLALVLHALRTLPPAGVLPLSALYDGLYELASTFQGHIVPHHLSDLTAEMPGLLTGIARLQQLDATEDHSIESDLLWAQAQLADSQRLQSQLGGAPADAGTAARRSGLAGLFRRGEPQPAGAGASPASARAWAAQAQSEWRDIIATLKALRSS